jgi:hypothetical protein
VGTTSGPDTQRMRADAADMTGARCAEWLRREFPEPRAKLIARQFGVSPRTVEKWLAGDMPANRAWLAMAGRWGWRFVAHVMEPAAGSPATAAAIRQDIAELRDRLAAIDARVEAAMKERP